MKKLYYIIFVIFFIVANAQNRDDNKSPANKERLFRDTIVLSSPNIIQIKNLSDEKSGDFEWSKNMPWIGAILIGITTVAANIIISRQSRRSNTAVTNQQIQNSKDIATEQIAAATKNSERDFKKTVLSASRQLWINDFRGIISELISITLIFSLKQKMSDDDEFKFNLLNTKSELMLSNHQSHLQLKKYLEELKTACHSLMMEDDTVEGLDQIITKIKDQTILILNSEWEKASKAE